MKLAVDRLSVSILRNDRSNWDIGFASRRLPWRVDRLRGYVDLDGLAAPLKVERVKLVRKMALGQHGPSLRREDADAKEDQPQGSDVG